MIKILKSGTWALGGTQIVELVEDEEKSFGPADDFALVEAGRAEWVAVKQPVEPEPEPEQESEDRPEVAMAPFKQKAK